MEKYEINRLRTIPIEEVAERLGIGVTRHKSLCPFHDDHHASLTYSARHNSYRCFACGAGGDTIDLVKRYSGMTFPEACGWLAEGYGIDIGNSGSCSPHGKDRPSTTQKPYIDAPKSPCLCPKEPAPVFDPTIYLRHFEHPYLSPEACRFLFDERKLDKRVVAWCRLTSWADRQGTHWLQIPYYAADGTLIGLQNRNLDYQKGGDKPRFRFPRGARCTIYNLPVTAMLRQGEPLYITEGASDCWAMLSAGHKAVAIPSATLLSQDDKDLLLTLAKERSTTFHMYPDSDTPGELLFLQLHDVLPSLTRHQLPPKCKDFAEYYLRVKSEECLKVKSEE